MKKYLLIQRLFIISIYLAITNGNLHAQKAGTIDLSFSDDGIVSSLSSSIYATEVAMQKDGKIIVGGTNTYYAIGTPLPNLTVTEFVLLRYHPKGTIDSSFGINGKVVTQISMASNIVSVMTDIIIQDDGKVLVSGRSLLDRSVIIRFNSNGSKDLSFGENGSYYFYGGVFRSLLLQQDGKIIATGNDLFGNVDLLAVRLNPNGVLDNTFDNDGITIIDLGNIENIHSSALQSDGKILIAGSSHSDSNFVIARLLSNGALDSSFNLIGKLLFPIGNLAECPSIVVQSDNKILIGGSIAINNNTTLKDFVIVRINSDGTFDRSFDYDGKLIIHYSQSNTILKLFIQSDGKILAIGNTGHSTTQQCLFRCNQDGSIDSTFGINGYVVTAIGTGSCHLLSGVLQKDGKIITVSYSDGINQMNLSRFHGVSNFNSNYGKIISQIGISNDRSNMIKILKNGKILSGGYSYNGTDKDFALMMYNSNGELDYSFGTNKSFITTNISFNSNDEITGIVIQTDGKILVTGNTISNLGNSDIVVSRYNIDGTLDYSFGNNGLVITGFSSNSVDESKSIFLQQDGKIVIAGSTKTGTNTNFAIIRYTQNGNLDYSFGTNGKVSTYLNSNKNIAKSIFVKSDGKIVVSGESGGNVAIVQYNSNGILDSSFGTNGYVITPLNVSEEVVSATAYQNDGKILLAGTSNYNGNNDFFVFKYSSNGLLDNSFGINGKTFIDFATIDSLFSISAYPSGKIIIAGSINNGSKIGICRLNNNGMLDGNFGNGGKKIIDVGYAFDVAKSTEIQEDGKIIIGGYYSNGADDDFILAKINEVNDFSVNNGKITSSFSFLNNEINSMLEQTDGKFILGGYTNNVSNNTVENNKSFVLTRYTNAGQLDLSFNTNGSSNTFFNGFEDYCTAIGLQNDGKIVSVGNSKNNIGNFDFALVRHLSNGNIDLTFGNNGKIITTFFDGDDICNSVVIQNDGKIIASGFAKNNNGNNDIVMARYASNGNLDVTFGVNGKSITDIQSDNDFSYSLKLQTDGKIVVGGTIANGGQLDFIVLRYSSSGILDQSFGIGGIVKIPISNLDDIGLTVAIQSDGKIVIGGTSFNGNDTHISIARLNTDGNLDNTFNGNGKLLLMSSSNKISMKKIILLSENKILIMGQKVDASQNKMVLIRINSNSSLDSTFDEDGILEKNMGTDNSFGNEILFSQSAKSLIIGGTYFNGSNLDLMLIKILQCDFETLKLINPIHNYPNSSLPNYQIGKNISASNYLLNLASINYNAKDFIDFIPGLRAENVTLFNTEIIRCAY